MIKPRQISAMLLILSLTGFEADARCAEEAIRTPSEQMKDAVEELNKARATIGKSLQGLTDAARAKLQQTLGSKAKADSKVEPVDLNVPQKTLDGVGSMRRTRGGPSMVCFQELNDRSMASGELLALLAACVIFIATMAGCSVSGDKK